MQLPTAPAANPGERGEALRFPLAAAACGPLVETAGARPAARPDAVVKAARMAHQMSLYDAPPVDPRAMEPRQTAAAPALAAPVSPPPPRSLPSAAGVARIRALVPAMADAARRHDIDPLLLHAVAHVESRHDAQARSPAGARGLMQVMPATARRFGIGDPHRELLVPELNTEVSAAYLKTLQRRFGNDLPLVLAAYNAGEGAVEKYGRRIPPYPETRAYVRDVLAVYALLKRRVLPAGRAAVAVKGTT